MTQIYAKGVEALINRIQEEGVNSGKERADKLIDDAHKQAAIVIDRAIKEAEQTIESAKKQAESELKSGQEALNLALRNMILDFRSVITKEFEDELGRMVTNVLENEKTIEKLILLVAKNTMGALGEYDEKEMTVLLQKPPQNMTQVSKQQSRADNELNELVNGIAYEVIEKGIQFSGIQITMKDKNVTVDFSDETLKKALVGYLQPRFAALIMGFNS